MNTQRIWRIGLTGGIGSGKSTVASMLAALGAAVIDADAISRSLTAPGGRAIAPIAQVFGPQMIDTLGALNRQAMREHVFQNAEAKKQLEAIIHPLVSQITQEQAQAALQSDHQVLVAFAIGQQGDKAQLPEPLQAREAASPRKAIADIACEGRFPG